jgi:cell wall-associated NlpC family hydrolase
MASVARVSLVLVLLATPVRAQAPHDRTRAPERSQAVPTAGNASSDSLSSSPHHEKMRTVIQRHLGRPYVWGASGIKSFDCSGFVWRVMSENGILIKRTTARKFYMSLPRVPDEQRWEFGNIVFFSDLKHCGVVDTREGFYHAAVTTGTHLSRFDPFWRRKISGVRAMPGRGH